MAILESVLGVRAAALFPTGRGSKPSGAGRVTSRTTRRSDGSIKPAADPPECGPLDDLQRNASQREMGPADGGSDAACLEPGDSGRRSEPGGRARTDRHDFAAHGGTM